MPVIMTPDKYEIWLDPDVNYSDVLVKHSQPDDADQLRRYPVSTKLNNSQDEGAESAAMSRYTALYKKDMLINEDDADSPDKGHPRSGSRGCMPDAARGCVAAVQAWVTEVQRYLS